MKSIFQFHRMWRKIILLFLICNAKIFAQPINYSYAKQIGSSNIDIGQSICVDSIGNAIITGFFEGVVDFDPGIGTTTMSALGLRDVYVVKLSPTGNLLWAKQFSGLDDEQAFSVTLDNVGNVYVTGDFKGTVDFDPGPTIFALTCTGGSNEDVFIVKLSSLGGFAWAKNVGGTSVDKAYGITTDIAGNCYLTGNFSGVADFDPGPSTFTFFASTNQTFILKLNSVGGFGWARTFNNVSGNGNAGQAIAIDQTGNVHVTGTYQGTVTFIPGPSPLNLVAVGQKDVYITKLDNSGNSIWAKSLSGLADEEGRGITVDLLGNVYTVGIFQNTVDFDPGLGVSNLIAGGNRNAFISKLNSSGVFVWAGRIGGISTDDWAHAVSLDALQNIYVAGSFNGTTDFDPGPGTFTIVSIANDNDVFITKLDPAGTLIWAKAFQGSMDDKANSIDLDYFGNVYTTGSFNSTVDFDPNIGVVNLFNPSMLGISDIFISKLSCEVPTITISTPTNGVCDGNTLTLTASGAITYTWSNGITNNTPFTPTISQTYSVFGTASTSCRSSNATTIAISVYPLPTVTANSSTNSICSGNTVVVLGAGALTYTWSSIPQISVSNNVPFSPTITATYSVVGKDSQGCIGANQATLNIIVNQLPQVQANATNSVVCSGHSVSLYGSGASTYTWTNGVFDNISFIPVTSSNYTVYGSNALGCSNFATIAITVNPLPVLYINSISNTVCIGETIILTANGAISYTWNIGTISNSISVAPNTTSTYSVLGTSNLGCIGDANISIGVDECVGVLESNNQNTIRLRVYPVPADEKINILFDFKPANLVIEIYSLDGKLFSNAVYDNPENLVSLNVDELPSGIYLLRMVGINQIYSAKFTVNH